MNDFISPQHIDMLIDEPDKDTPGKILLEKMVNYLRNRRRCKDPPKDLYNEVARELLKFAAFFAKFEKRDLPSQEMENALSALEVFDLILNMAIMRAGQEDSDIITEQGAVKITAAIHGVYKEQIPELGYSLSDIMCLLGDVIRQYNLLPSTTRRSHCKAYTGNPAWDIGHDISMDTSMDTHMITSLRKLMIEDICKFVSIDEFIIDSLRDEIVNRVYNKFGLPPPKFEECEPLE